jgi:hypothetical protein
MRWFRPNLIANSLEDFVSQTSALKKESLGDDVVSGCRGENVAGSEALEVKLKRLCWFARWPIFHSQYLIPFN